MSSPTIFVSHSSKDEEMATAFVDLLRAALPVRQQQIRCSSVPGYGFRGGVRITDEVLNEIKNAPVFVAMVTRNFLTSSPCCFEWGARWASSGGALALFGGGATAKDVTSWLTESRGYAAEKENDLLDLVRLLEGLLEAQGHPRGDVAQSSYQRHLKQVTAESISLAERMLDEVGALDLGERLLNEAAMIEVDGSEAMRLRLQTFWNIASEEYDRFRNEEGSARDYPKDLLGFIRAAGPPSNIVGEDPSLWATANAGALQGPQLRMWRYVSGIYPTGRRAGQQPWEIGSITPVERATLFDRCRRELAKEFWDSHLKKVGWVFVKDRYRTKAEELYLLSWLEIALAVALPQSGNGKQKLFRTADRFAKMLAAK